MIAVIAVAASLLLNRLASKDCVILLVEPIVFARLPRLGLPVLNFHRVFGEIVDGDDFIALGYIGTVGCEDDGFAFFELKFGETFVVHFYFL